MSEELKTVALLVAAGSGERLRAGLPKAFVELDGKTLLRRSLEALSASPSIGQIVVALPPGARAPDGLVETAAAAAGAAPDGLTAPTAAAGAAPDNLTAPTAAAREQRRLVTVPGGATRSQSVALALAAAAPSSLVLVHDAARPLVSVSLIEAVLQAVQVDGVDAAIAAIPLTDTVKEASPPSATGSGSEGQGLPIVSRTIPREHLWAVQTPQAFRRPALARVLAQPEEVLAQATDDASLIERAGGTVVLVPSSPSNLKITTETDLHLASTLLERPERD